ncbi:unnamed protein product [Rangifer tarandus platyrhynchus]|uniref:Uncharacterized protein n=1 Tax=Rangifer tarandus platyrhynchus TaxID=3082113 RepID=A0ABN9A073_RANTA|nr:unnamed protein product [Rangifer tarandus platyrhynchus]
MDTEEGPWRRRAEKQKQEQSCRPGERRRGCREVRDRRAGYARDKQGPSGSARGPWRRGGCGTGSRGAEETRWREEKNEGRVGHSFPPRGSVFQSHRCFAVCLSLEEEERKKMSEQPPRPPSLLPVEASLARGGAQRRPLPAPPSARSSPLRTQVLPGLARSQLAHAALPDLLGQHGPSLLSGHPGNVSDALLSTLAYITCFEGVPEVRGCPRFALYLQSSSPGQVLRCAEY